MKKILTIATTALLSTFAGSAHAQLTGTVLSPGTVDASCNITATAPGALVPNAPVATSLSTPSGSLGKITVICNTDTSTLSLGAGTHTIPAQVSPPGVTYGFASGGTGIYSAITSANGVGPTAPAGDVTLAIGDTVNVTSSISATGGKVLKKGAYATSIVGTLTP